MAERKLKRRTTVPPGGTLVLDCAGLSGLIDDVASVVALVAEARRRRMEVVISALTIIEAAHQKTDQPRLSWLLSGLRTEPVDDTRAKAASELLLTAGLHGHKYAIDAVVAEMSLRQPPPVIMITSDQEDMHTLCGGKVRLIPV